MKKILLISLFTILLYNPANVHSQEKVFDALLKTYVTNDGSVDYKGLRKNKAILDLYLDDLKKTIPGKKWSSNKAKAFWINVYNAYAVKLILDSYPLTKITDIKRKGKNAWKIPFANVGGQQYSLDFIEHKILRRWHDDPRIHVGINAASKSGPKFINFVFTEKNVDKKLEELMKSFINDTSKNKISITKMEISKIFDWYKDDFTAKGGTIVDYINEYSGVMANDDATLSYLDYDWTLNDKR